LCLRHRLPSRAPPCFSSERIDEVKGAIKGYDPFGASPRYAVGPTGPLRVASAGSENLWVNETTSREIDHTVRGERRYIEEGPPNAERWGQYQQPDYAHIRKYGY